MPSPLTVDRFRRLARSSPWLWRTLEFRVRRDSQTAHHAWIRRPGSLRVEDSDGRIVQTELATRPFPGLMVDSGSGFRPATGLWPAEVDPVYAEDGLVESMPDSIDVDYNDPMFENYHWVAMLNPIELADGADADDPQPKLPVELRDLTVITHRGRPAWEAVAQSTGAYNPCCHCCSLLHGEQDYESDEWQPDGPTRVRLDAATGVCVFLEHNGRVELDVEILSVDEPLDDALFTTGRGRS